MKYAPRRFAARMSALSAVIAYIDEVCLRAGLDAQQAMRVELVIEELFTNTVSHGYGEDSEQPVWISADSEAGRLLIMYQDEARACNPLECDPQPSNAGGEGIKLIKQFCAANYLREDGRNTLQLTFTD